MLSLSPRRTAVLSCGALVAMAAWLRAGAPLPGSSPDAPGRAATAATTELREAIESEAAALRAIASAALDRVGGSPASAFDALTGLVADNPRRSVAATRDGLVSAWGGRYLGPTDSLSGPIGVVGNEFHLVLYAVVIRDSDRAVASSLIHAAPPGDGLARGLDIAIVENGDVAGFTFGSPGAPLPEGAQLATVGDTPVIGVRATPLEPAAYAARQAERRQLWGGFLLALAAVVVLVRIWRRAQARGRVGVLAMVVVLVAIVPLSAYSNASVLFSPAVFYVAEGGPLSGSIAAVALVAATLLAGVLAAYRADALPRARIWSVVTIGIVAVVAPFVITAVARGIRYPADGASPLLWIAWETAVFLTATLALVTMIAVGGARTADRGLPPWVAVLLAAGATAVAPMVVTARGGLPTWYAVVWAVAIVAVAVSRRGAARIGAAAAVAAFGAAAVTWSETVKARVVLAELDVSSLSVADSGTSALLRRFPLQLDSNSAARSRAELMAQFAASELASSNHPIDLTTWSPGGAAVMVDLRVGLGPGTARGVEYFARMAAETRQPVLTHVPGEQSMLTVLALPHVDGTVTTAVLSPRTRLVAPDPFPTITGLAPRRGGGEDPPYTLQASPADLTQYVSSEAAWTRRNDEIHGDWFLPSGAQVLHVHARVPLSTYGALATRGALLVFANLALFGAVWLLLVVADGGARRPLLDATTTWLRSYRARLTVSLFGAFVLPAAAFTTWSYTRLRDDDARARDVLVGETLRGVLASPSTGIDSLAARFDAPLFLFANGVLVASSDPLFDALAPIGRLLPAEAAAALLQDDDGFATADLVVGGAPMRFGFRAIADSGNGGRLVLGVPARTAGLALDQQRTDLVYLGAVITISGALLALWLSGIAARAL
ncbi:MAG: hypothetical protein FJ202_07400, partial [Gemmatimonadetes bacterium]|nr:hypothetical protein [Gemmatimonadota bacterium]